MVRLADTLFRLIREYEIAHPTERVKIDSKLTRILERSADYRRLRRRTDKRSGRSAKEPSFFTIADAATMLGVPLCALVPTIEHQPVTEPQREVLTKYARWTLAQFAPRDDERQAYTSDFDDFEPYVTIRKYAETLAAGQAGTDQQFEPDEADVLASIRGIREERLQVIPVRGNSMAERIHDGDRVLIDISLRSPRDGDIVAVDREHLGRTIGYWRRKGKQYQLEKHNAAEATITLGPPGQWSILGTITRIVDAPLRPSDRRRVP